MKRITIELTDDAWKELSDTVRHEFGELLSESIEENRNKGDFYSY